MDNQSDLRKWAESQDPNVPSWVPDDVLSLIEEVTRLAKIVEGVPVDDPDEKTEPGPFWDTAESHGELEGG